MNSGMSEANSGMSVVNVTNYSVKGMGKTLIYLM